MTGVFESMSYDTDRPKQIREASKKKNEKALFVVASKFKDYLKAAKTDAELNDRIELARADIAKAAKDAGAVGGYEKSKIIADLKAEFPHRTRSSVASKRTRSRNLLRKNASAGWTMDNTINSYVANGDTPFSCTCGQKISQTGRKMCSCGKQWNYWTIQSKNGTKSFCREVPLRDNKIASVEEGDQITLSTEDGEELEATVTEVEGEEKMARSAKRGMVRRDRQRVSNTRNARTKRAGNYDWDDFDDSSSLNYQSFYATVRLENGGYKWTVFLDDPYSGVGMSVVDTGDGVSLSDAKAMAENAIEVSGGTYARRASRRRPARRANTRRVASLNWEDSESGNVSGAYDDENGFYAEVTRSNGDGFQFTVEKLDDQGAPTGDNLTEVTGIKTLDEAKSQAEDYIAKNKTARRASARRRPARKSTASVTKRHADALRRELKQGRNARERQFIAGYFLASRNLPLPEKYVTASSVKGYKAGKRA